MDSEINSAGVELLTTLKVAAEKFGMTELSRQAGIPRGHLYTIFSGEGNPTLVSFIAIATVLGFQVKLAKTEA